MIESSLKKLEIEIIDKARECLTLDEDLEFRDITLRRFLENDGLIIKNKLCSIKRSGYSYNFYPTANPIRIYYYSVHDLSRTGFRAHKSIISLPVVGDNSEFNPVFRDVEYGRAIEGENAVMCTSERAAVHAYEVLVLWSMYNNLKQSLKQMEFQLNRTQTLIEKRLKKVRY